MTALPGTPAIQNAIPMAFFHTTLFAAPVLGVIASAIMLGFGLWWLRLIATRASEAGEGYSPETQKAVDDPLVRARGANCRISTSPSWNVVIPARIFRRLRHL